MILGRGGDPHRPSSDLDLIGFLSTSVRSLIVYQRDKEDDVLHPLIYSLGRGLEGRRQTHCVCGSLSGQLPSARLDKPSPPVSSHIWTVGGFRMGLVPMQHVWNTGEFVDLFSYTTSRPRAREPIIITILDRGVSEHGSNDSEKEEEV